MNLFEFMQWTVNRLAGMGGGFALFCFYILMGSVLYYIYRLIRYGMFILGVLLHGWPDDEYEEDEEGAEDD